MQDKKPHILVIDDDWMNQEVIQAHLEIEHYGVTTTAHGKEGLAIAFANPPDLVILDALLPDISGFEVCAQLKSHDTTRFVPVIMVTALESEEDKLKAVEAGADDFITKPFSFILLMTRVKSLIRMKSLHDDLHDSNTLIRRILNRYVDEYITEIILVDPERYLKLGGETREVTILFADISGFTAFAEKHPAQEVVKVLNKIFSELTALIFKYHGTFDKYIGDEIMAFFGAPVASEKDTLNAVLTAWDMQRTFSRLRQEMGEEVEKLTLEIGLHRGEVAIGNVGSERVMNYTVIGDAVNTAHRLQEAAHHEQILISEAIYQLVKDVVEVTLLPPQNLPGKREPMVVYQITNVKT